jgi:hypothetical protein
MGSKFKFELFLNIPFLSHFPLVKELQKFGIQVSQYKVAVSMMMARKIFGEVIEFFLKWLIPLLKFKPMSQ